jgi:hypothetical protein
VEALYKLSVTRNRSLIWYSCLESALGTAQVTPRWQLHSGSQKVASRDNARYDMLIEVGISLLLSDPPYI